MASGEQRTGLVLTANKREAAERYNGDHVLSVEDVGSNLHVSAAKALGWPLKDVQSMSLQSLREAVRHVDPALAEDMSSEIRSGRVLTRTKRASGKRGTIKADVSWLGEPPTAEASARYEQHRSEVLARNAPEGRPSLPPGTKRG